MICDWCGLESGALSYDVEFGYLCPVCRSKLNADESLRRCPFCKSHEVELIAINELAGVLSRFTVICGGCRATGPRALTRADATAAWNRAPRVRE